MRKLIENAGVGLAFVHMSDPAAVQPFFARYGLDDVPRVADRQRRLYRAFGLRQGGARELFGLDVWRRGFGACIRAGHGMGLPDGDARQMPGAFLIAGGRIVRSFRAGNIADHPDWGTFATRDGAAGA